MEYGHIEDSFDDLGEEMASTFEKEINMLIREAHEYTERNDITTPEAFVTEMIDRCVNRAGREMGIAYEYLIEELEG